MVPHLKSVGVQPKKKNNNNNEFHIGNSLAVQWLGLHDFTAEGEGSIRGRGNKIPQAPQPKKRKKKKKKEKCRGDPCPSLARWLSRLRALQKGGDGYHGILGCPTDQPTPPAEHVAPAATPACPCLSAQSIFEQPQPAEHLHTSWE